MVAIVLLGSKSLFDRDSGWLARDGGQLPGMPKLSRPASRKDLEGTMTTETLMPPRALNTRRP